MTCCSAGSPNHPFRLRSEENTNTQSNAYSEYRSLTGAFRHLLATSGVRGLFQGFTATAVRDAPYAGLYVVFYEKCKELAGEFLPCKFGRKGDRKTERERERDAVSSKQ